MSAEKTKVKVKSVKTEEKSPMAKLFSLEQLKESNEKASETIKNLAYFQLGVYGKVFDEVNDFVQARLDSAPKWGDLVERGTKVQGDITKAQEKVKSRIKDFDLKSDVQGRVEKVIELVEKAKGSVKKAA